MTQFAGVLIGYMTAKNVLGLVVANVKWREREGGVRNA